MRGADTSATGTSGKSAPFRSKVAGPQSVEKIPLACRTACRDPGPRAPSPRRGPREDLVRERAVRVFPGNGKGPLPPACAVGSRGAEPPNGMEIWNGASGKDEHRTASGLLERFQCFSSALSSLYRRTAPATTSRMSSGTAIFSALMSSIMPSTYPSFSAFSKSGLRTPSMRVSHAPRRSPQTHSVFPAPDLLR